MKEVGGGGHQQTQRGGELGVERGGGGWSEYWMGGRRSATGRGHVLRQSRRFWKNQLRVMSQGALMPLVG